MIILTLIILAIFALMFGVLGMGILLTPNAPEIVIAVIVILVLLRFMFKKRKS